MGAKAMEADCNFVEADSWATREMTERLTWLRENEPIYWSEQTGLWVITRYRDAEFISKNQDIFTSEFGVRPATDTVIGLIDEAEPRHAALRGMINKGFTPRMVKILELKFREITKQAIDSIATKGECDFVASISVPLPIRLIAHMIGIREEDQEHFHKWSDDLIAADGNRDKPEVMQKAAQAYMEYAGYVTAIIEDRRQNPKEDLVSILTGAKDDGLLRIFDKPGAAIEDAPPEYNDLANDELIMLLVILMIAGNETTRNAISGGMELLIENPDERQKLLDDPSLISSAVEEMVRLVSPVQTFGRTLTRNYELGGKAMKEGQEVCLIYPAANRDPEIYEDAERFDVKRNPQHLGFGIGSHFCLGANLARMEMRVAFEELLRRLPDMEYSRGGPVFQGSSLVRSCAEMWVKYTPES
jgi:cytochrome P450 family 142 subfamily A polypeptide 1